MGATGAALLDGLGVGAITGVVVVGVTGVVSGARAGTTGGAIAAGTGAITAGALLVDAASWESDVAQPATAKNDRPSQRDDL